MTTLPAQRDDRGRFVTGNSGGGRPKGSRNKLGEAFLADLHDLWKEQGQEALRRMCEEDPSAFVRVIASVLPKELQIDQPSPYEEMSEEESNARLLYLSEQMAPELGWKIVKLDDE